MPPRWICGLQGLVASLPARGATQGEAKGVGAPIGCGRSTSTTGASPTRWLGFSSLTDCERLGLRAEPKLQRRGGRTPPGPSAPGQGVVTTLRRCPKVWRASRSWTVGPSPPIRVGSLARRRSHRYLSARLRGAPVPPGMRSLTLDVTGCVRPAFRALAVAACRTLSHAISREPGRAAGPSHRARDLLRRWRQGLRRAPGRAMFPLFSAQSEWDCPCSILGEEVLQGRVQ